MGCRKYFFFYLISQFLGYFLYNPQIKGSFENHVDMIFWFFHQPPSSVVIFYVLNMDIYGKFLTRYPPSVVYITVGLNLQETLKKNGHKIPSYFWYLSTRKPNFFDPSMTIGGAAISFFLTWIFWLKFLMGNNFVKKIGFMHFWNQVLSKKLNKMAKKWNLKLCWSLVKTLSFCSKHGKLMF